MEYDLYLESGPKRRKTMVHVLDLLGCFAVGPTTEQAIEAAPDAIRSYLAFLRRHDEDVPDSHEPIRVRAAQHITKGTFLGMGSPTIIFDGEKEPLSANDMEKYLRWLDWARGELIDLVGRLSEDEFTASQPGRRSIKEILRHIGQVEQWYLKNLGGLDKVKRCSNVLEKLTLVREAVHRRLRSLTDEERAKVFLAPGPFSSPVGDPWTVRKCLRRCLEHQWEHLQETASRVGAPPSIFRSP